MEVALLVGLAALLARAVRFVGATHGRDRRAGATLLEGLFTRPDGLGWPPGVQEEDRDRIWSWSPPPETVEGDLIDAGVAAVPVQRVH